MDELSDWVSSVVGDVQAKINATLGWEILEEDVELMDDEDNSEWEDIVIPVAENNLTDAEKSRLKSFQSNLDYFRDTADEIIGDPNDPENDIDFKVKKFLKKFYKRKTEAIDLFAG